MASGPITSWQIDGETMETGRDFILGAPKSLQMVTVAMKLKDPCHVAQLVKKLPAVLETKVQFLGQEDPLEKNGNPLQYSCLENPVDRRAWQATVHRVARVRHDLVLSFSFFAPWKKSHD